MRVSPFCYLTAWLGMGLTVLPGQTRGPEAVKAPPPGETVTLNPFVVSENDAVGYAANSTLSGTRINTPLRDLGAAVSIITSEFLADTAATNLGELLSLTMATEVGGAYGNFAGGEQSAGLPDQSESRENPQNNQRVRGIGPATATRDYFVTDIPFDAYNTSRVTINRGPNSLLFGIGNPAGIIEASTQQPRLDRNRTQTAFRYGSQASYRGTIDVNRVLKRNRLAFRLAALSEENNYQQEPAFERKHRLFTAVEGVLRAGRPGAILGRTSLRLSGEIGDTQSTPVNVLPPLNSMNIFFAPPNPTIDDIPGVALNLRLKQGSPTYSWTPRVTVDNRSASSTIAAANPGLAVPYFIQVPLVYDTPGQVKPGYMSSNNPALAGIAGIMGRVRYAQVPNGRAAIDTFVTTNTLYPGFVAPTLQDRRVFDYRNHLLSGGTNRVEQTFQVGNLALTQELFDGRGGLEIAFSQQQMSSTRMLPFSFGNNSGVTPASAISIDVAQYLTNDQPNPNLGRPFIEQQGIQDRVQERTRNAFRATLFYRLDLEQRGRTLFGLSLGNHTLTALHNAQRVDAFNRNYALGWTSKTRDLNTDVFQATISSAFRTAPVMVQYLGPSAITASSLSDVRITQLVTAPIPRDGEVHNVTFFDFINKKLVTEPLTVTRFLNGGSKSRQLVDSQSLSLKSDFFQDTLVSVVGWRWDNLATYSSEGNVRLPNDTLDLSSTRLRAAPDLDESSHSLTWSVVARLPKRLATKLPFGTELSVFYNTSGNFSPVNVRSNLLGEIIPAPEGSTKEYGFLLEFFNRRASLRINEFRTLQSNTSNNAQGATSGVFGYAEFLASRYLVAQTEGIAFNSIPGVTTAGYTSYQQLYNTLFQLLPEPTRRLNNLRFTNPTTLASDSIQGLTDTSDIDARGIESELVGNLTQNWRVSFNLAKQETIVSGTALLTKTVADAVYTNLVKFNLLGIDQGPALPSRATAASRFRSNVSTPLAIATARDGAVSPEQRKWRANFVTSYDLRQFENPILKALTLGTAVRWQSKIAIGNPFLTGERLKQKIVASDKTYSSPSQISDTDPVMESQFPDLDKTIYGPEELAGDFWVAYRRKTFKTVDWRLQLNIRNAWGNRGDIPVTANPDGTIAVIRIPNETRWTLSSTFTF